MDSICNFIPVKSYTGSIRTVHFVLESELKKLTQPFYYPINYVFLVISGSGVLKLNSKEYKLEKGSLFFSFPNHFFEIDGNDDFKYIYISFMGESVKGIFDDLNISPDNPVFYNMDFVVDFWLNSIRRVTAKNSNLLTEGVLLYTLSFINDDQERLEKNTETDNKFDLVIYYIDNHYTEYDMCLKKVADVFSYTPKYFSHIFKENMNVGFSEYINRLRIQYACRLIAQGITKVSELALSCGFSDALYFSKVFKKKTGFSPNEYIKRQTLKTD